MLGDGEEDDYFNSHTREGVTGNYRYLCGGRKYFNSHTREGVTVHLERPCYSNAISTHTPVRV